jgi:hypothetical protein
MDPGSGAGALTGHSGFGRAGAAESRRVALFVGAFFFVAAFFGAELFVADVRGDDGEDAFAAGSVRSVRFTESARGGGGVESPPDCAPAAVAMSDVARIAIPAAREGETRIANGIECHLELTRAG